MCRFVDRKYHYKDLKGRGHLSLEVCIIDTDIEDSVLLTSLCIFGDLNQYISHFCIILSQEIIDYNLPIFWLNLIMDWDYNNNC